MGYNLKDAKNGKSSSKIAKLKPLELKYKFL